MNVDDPKTGAAKPDSADAETTAITEATLLVEELSAALVNVRIYASSHPRVTGSLVAVRKGVRALTAASREPGVRILCVERLVVYGKRPLPGASIAAARLIALLGAWGGSGIEIDADIDDAALQQFFAALVERPRPGHTWSHFNEALATRNCRHARMLPPYVEGSRPPVPEDHVRVGIGAYQAVVDLLQTITVSVCRGGRIDFSPVAAQAEALLDRLANSGELRAGLARQDQYDAFTLGHSLRVAILALHFARSLTEDRDLLVRIGTAALLHDVGKSLIPFEILHSTGTLSEEERRQMNRHSELGAQCLLDHRDADPLAVASAFGHHRTSDGGGYPRTTHQHHVGLVTNIVKICDVFEALTAARPYKQPMSPIRAYRVMIAMGNKLDQKLLRRFIDVNGIYPIGQLLELDSGQVAVVREQGDNPLLPRIAVLEQAIDLDIVDEDEQIFDLGDVACCSAKSVLQELTPDEARTKLNAPR
jgi:putative nucleotidyltransferase with HDIG domain